MTIRTDETDARVRNSTHILLVDDCEVNRSVAGQYLERAGYRVDMAATGRQAVEAYEYRSYDLILMDLVMPDMDGFEASRRMRKAEGGRRRAVRPRAHGRGAQPIRRRNKIREDLELKSEIGSVPIVAMSGLVTEEVAAECRAAGMNDCIAKPFQRETLVMMVQKWTASQPKFQNFCKAPKATSMTDRTSVDDPVPIELEKTIEEFMGKTDILLDVIMTFRHRVKMQIAGIRRNISEKNYRQIFLEAHSIKGGAGNLRAFKLSNTAAGLENAAIEEALEETVARIDELEDEFNRLNHYLDQTGLPQLYAMAHRDC